MAKRNLLTFADLSDNMKNALRLLRDGKTCSTMEIQKELLIPVTTLRSALNRLHLFELVDEIQHHNGNQWLIANKGIELLSQNEQYYDKSEPVEVSPETKDLLTEALNETLSVTKIGYFKHDEIEPVAKKYENLSNQEAIVHVPCEKIRKPQEMLTLGFVAFWLQGKAREFQEMAEMIRSQIERD